MANVDTGIDVFVRKRPQFKHEVQRGEYDIVTVPFENQVQCPAPAEWCNFGLGGVALTCRHWWPQVVVHNCQMYPDLKRMLIKHQGFPATCAFGHQVGRAFMDRPYVRCRAGWQHSPARSTLAGGQYRSV
jgi:hypothetical protein